jgi:hypothetical protein
MAVEENGFGESRPAQTHEGRTKKVYSPPRLLEWGSMTDLTQGFLLGNHDFPVKGGTRNT